MQTLLPVVIILLPLAAAVAAASTPSARLRPFILPAVAFLHLALCLRTIHVATGIFFLQGLLGLDALGGLILLVNGILFAASSVYAIGYFGSHPDWDNRIFIVCLLVFLAAMTMATMSRHLGLLWVTVETTTLVSAPLIYYNKNRFSIEATWKYLLLCSVGIALAMLGILFVAYAGLHGTGSADITLDRILLTAASYSKPWLRAGYVFLLVGFGTKMGLAPLHTWKPDAYGEAPGLVGGLLAGGLTSVAFLAVLRVVQIMYAAGEATLVRQTLQAMGLLSLAVAAAFVIRQRDIKRMLAYSSVEHMGILALGVASGGLALYGAMFHLLNNALTKGALFMSAGNIHRFFGSKFRCEIQGSLGVLPVSGGIFLAGFLAITGSPPFAPFLSELTILRGMFANGQPVSGGLLLFFLAIIFIGMGSTVIPVTLGPAMEESEPRPPAVEPLTTILAPLVLLAMVLALGIFVPERLQQLFLQAAAVLEIAP